MHAIVAQISAPNDCYCRQGKEHQVSTSAPAMSCLSGKNRLFNQARIHCASSKMIWSRYMLTRAQREHKNFSSASSGNSDPAAVDRKVLALYRRDPDRIMLPRAAFGISIFNTTYWTWYSFDFIPAVNASPVEDLHIDPSIGYGALALGVAINVMTALYPSMLVSKLNYDEERNLLLLYGYAFPFLTASKSPTPYALGDIMINAGDSDLKKILGDYKGDWGRYKGHLALQRKDGGLPLLLEVQSANYEILRGQDLLEALLRPKAFLSSRKPDKTRKGKRGAKQTKRRIE